MVGTRRIKAAHYVHQGIDVKEMVEGPGRDDGK